MVKYVIYLSPLAIGYFFNGPLGVYTPSTTRRCSTRRCCISPTRRAEARSSTRRWDTASTRRARTRSDRNKFKYYCMPSRRIDGTNTTWRHTTTITTTQNTTINHIFSSFFDSVLFHGGWSYFPLNLFLNWKKDLQWEKSTAVEIMWEKSTFSEFQMGKKYFRWDHVGIKYFFWISNGKKVIPLRSCGTKVHGFLW